MTIGPFNTNHSQALWYASMKDNLEAEVSKTDVVPIFVSATQASGWAVITASSGAVRYVAATGASSNWGFNDGNNNGCVRFTVRPSVNANFYPTSPFTTAVMFQAREAPDGGQASRSRFGIAFNPANDTLHVRLAGSSFIASSPGALMGDFDFIAGSIYEIEVNWENIDVGTGSVWAYINGVQSSNIIQDTARITQQPVDVFTIGNVVGASSQAPTACNFFGEYRHISVFSEAQHSVNITSFTPVK